MWYLLRSPKWSWGFMIWYNLSVVWLLTLFALNRKRFSVYLVGSLIFLFFFWYVGLILIKSISFIYLKICATEISFWSVCIFISCSELVPGRRWFMYMEFAFIWSSMSCWPLGPKYCHPLKWIVLKRFENVMLFFLRHSGTFLKVCFSFLVPF